MSFSRLSPCKVNLLLNILRKRADGFHELETVFQPVPIHDTLCFERGGQGIALTCSLPELSAGPDNLVHRAAAAFLAAAKIKDGVQIHLEKCLPLAAGLGGGSANAAVTLVALNDLFERPLEGAALHTLAAGLGSDVPFFLQSQPGLGVGRGEQIQPLAPFAALKGLAILLVYPGFGVSTAWAYQNLARYPEALQGRPGRAQELINLLQTRTIAEAAPAFYNSLEAPVLPKYPLLAVLQEFLRAEGALAAMMSGSGSTTFAVARDTAQAQRLAEQVKARFGAATWTAVASL